MNAAAFFCLRCAPEHERRDGLSPSRRKEDLAVYLACTNLKLMADEGAPRESLVEQIDYLHDLMNQIMDKHRPQPEVPGVTRKDATDEQTNAA